MSQVGGQGTIFAPGGIKDRILGDDFYITDEDGNRTNPFQEAYEGINLALMNVAKAESTGIAGVDVAAQKQAALLQEDYSTDILEAYDTSIAQQNAIMASNLGQGYKAKMSMDLETDLDKAYDSFLRNYQSNLSNIESDAYTKFQNIISNATQQRTQLEGMSENVNAEIENISNNVAKFGNSFAGYANKLLNVLTNMSDSSLLLDLQNDPAWSDIFGVITENQDGTFTINPSAFNALLFDENNELTDKGREIINLLWNAPQQLGIYSMGDYLSETDPELYEWLLGQSQYSNQWADINGNYNNISMALGLFGLDPSQVYELKGYDAEIDMDGDGKPDAWGTGDNYVSTKTDNGYKTSVYGPTLGKKVDVWNRSDEGFGNIETYEQTGENGNTYVRTLPAASMENGKLVYGDNKWDITYTGTSVKPGDELYNEILNTVGSIETDKLYVHYVDGEPKLYIARPFSDMKSGQKGNYLEEIESKDLYNLFNYSTKTRGDVTGNTWSGAEQVTPLPEIQIENGIATLPNVSNTGYVGENGFTIYANDDVKVGVLNSSHDPRTTINRSQTGGTSGIYYVNGKAYSFETEIGRNYSNSRIFNDILATVGKIGPNKVYQYVTKNGEVEYYFSSGSGNNVYLEKIKPESQLHGLKMSNVKLPENVQKQINTNKNKPVKNTTVKTPTGSTVTGAKVLTPFQQTIKGNNPLMR